MAWILLSLSGDVVRVYVSISEEGDEEGKCRIKCSSFD